MMLDICSDSISTMLAVTLSLIMATIKSWQWGQLSISGIEDKDGDRILASLALGSSGLLVTFSDDDEDDDDGGRTLSVLSLLLGSTAIGSSELCITFDDDCDDDVEAAMTFLYMK